MKKKQLCFCLLILLLSCTNVEDKIEDISGNSSFRKIRLVSYAEAGTSLTNVNCYLFHKGVFYKKYSNLSLSGEGSVEFNIPAHAELYFSANMIEPTAVANMQEGVTTRDFFLSFHTPVDEPHSSTRAPSKFYSARVNPDITASPTFNIKLESSLSRIDLDASDASGSIRIERIYTQTAPKTTSYFPSDALSHATEKCTYSHTFGPPEAGKAEDIFRIYESDSPVTFIMEGTYGDKPIIISTPIKQIKRNKIYKIRIQSAGMNVESSILTEDWKTGDEITATEGASAAIKIDADRSILPSGISMNDSRIAVEIPHTGVTRMKLAFLTENPLQLNSVEGRPQSISSPEISNWEGKYLTSYEITLAPNTSQLTSCVTLNLKSTSGEQNIYGKITLNIQSFPYKIREVTIGGNTWMAFNLSTSQSLSDQIYPESYGYSEPLELYEKNWQNSLGGMHQWSDNPCPEGYRLPTQSELSDLLSGQPSPLGGGSIPGKWLCNGDVITSKISTSAYNTVNINGISAATRYLEIKNERGTALYFPLGGMKNNTSEIPDYGNSLWLWSSGSSGLSTAYAYKLIYTDRDPIIIPDTEFNLNKEAYASVRCIKTNF